MMIVVVVVFAVSWLPFQAFALLHSVLNSAAALPARTAFLLTLAFYWLAMSTSASNPLIYFYMNRRYEYIVLQRTLHEHFVPQFLFSTRTVACTLPRHKPTRPAGLLGLPHSPGLSYITRNNAARGLNANAGDRYDNSDHNSSSLH